MDNFDMVIALINEAKIERDLVRDYELDNNHARETGDFSSFFTRWYPGVPRKQIVNDNIKLARRLLLKEYM